MRSPFSFALTALLIAPAAQPGTATHAAWKWQRTIVPNAASPGDEQCAVLDADLFAGAAPGLRDVRLVQDGRELAYAIDESVDEGAGSGPNPADDRSLYDTVATAGFVGIEPRGSLFPQSARVAAVSIPARVPVERLRLVIADSAQHPTALPFTMHVTVTARPQAPDGIAGEPEIVDLQAAPQRLLLPVTLGANLQQSAGVTVHVDAAPASLTGVALEMRRREICYQPLSLSPVTLLFGNPAALPVHYEFGRYFQPKVTPLLSTVGPVHANPEFHSPLRAHAGFSSRVKLILAILACALALALTLRPLLRVKR